MTDQPDDDGSDTLTLDVGDRPSIEQGDTLHVRPDVGDWYRAVVIEIDGDTLRVRLPGGRQSPGPHPTPPQSRTWHREEIEGWHVRGDLRINPDLTRALSDPVARNPPEGRRRFNGPPHGGTTR